jgi:type IV pilus assembly protein PilX
MENTMQRTPPFFLARQRQRGISLFVVIVLVMLSMLIALWASRTALFNEMIVGNDADYQRAFEAAQALLQDAELDVRGENSNGSTCVIDGSNGNVCRNSTQDKIPLEEKDVAALLADLDGATGDAFNATASPNVPLTKCRNGLCLKRVGLQDFWNNNTAASGVTLAQMTSGVGARYGQYTGAAFGLTGSGSTSNPILADRSAANRGGWYWIEVLPYDATAGNTGLVTNGSNNLALNLQPNVVYRVTAIAYGLKPNTRVVLQQTYARQKRKD